ncbi:MAG: hypothetical protein JNJ75_16730 [Cyclobacteriaceae bacterium]|nr:hypothetical protein [Cyclobacteriaceae bacterium]
MDIQNKVLLDSRIKQYLTERIRQEFQDDFNLIAKDFDKLVERYSLKELMIVVRLEIDRIKNPRKN